MNSQTQTLSPILTAGVIGVFSLFASYPAFAIEPPPDNAKPPAALLDGAEKIDEVPAKLPFIGVVTASLPDMLADHLNLEPGTGVIVRTVMPDSPADQSGIKTNDIILNINETVLKDPETFSTKIRSQKIGDKLKLKTIQKGKPKDIEVTLAERPAGQIAEIPDRKPLFDGVPDAEAMRLRDLIERNLDALGQNGFEEMLAPEALADERLRMLRERMNRALEDAPQVAPGEMPKIQLQQQSTVRMMDNQGSVEIKTIGENTEVIVRNPANEIVWSGPWDTEQDKAAAPDDIRLRIDKINIKKGGGINLRLER
ncbi:MAG: PDZ domain-containing protein [Verrucomicrobiota bacterium]